MRETRWPPTSRRDGVAMTELARPALRFHASWAAAVREFGADGSACTAAGLFDFDTRDLGPDALAREVARLLAEGDPATVLRTDRVHCSYFWIVEGADFLGYLALRHSLNDFLLDQGGHIGYSVRPSRRRRATPAGPCCWRWARPAGWGSSAPW